MERVTQRWTPGPGMRISITLRAQVILTGKPQTALGEQWPEEPYTLGKIIAAALWLL